MGGADGVGRLHGTAKALMTALKSLMLSVCLAVPVIARAQTQTIEYSKVFRFVTLRALRWIPPVQLCRT